MNENTIKSKLHRGEEQLREQLSWQSEKEETDMQKKAVNISEQVFYDALGAEL